MMNPPAMILTNKTRSRMSALSPVAARNLLALFSEEGTPMASAMASAPPPAPVKAAAEPRPAFSRASARNLLQAFDEASDA